MFVSPCVMVYKYLIHKTNNNTLKSKSTLKTLENLIHVVLRVSTHASSLGTVSSYMFITTSHGSLLTLFAKLTCTCKS